MKCNSLESELEVSELKRKAAVLHALELKDEVAKLRAALEFYADRVNWVRARGHGAVGNIEPAQLDKGRVARKALGLK
jgi:hypothetical protein